MSDSEIFTLFLNGESMVSLITKSGLARPAIETAIRKGFNSILLNDGDALRDILQRDWPRGKREEFASQIVS